MFTLRVFEIYKLLKLIYKFWDNRVGLGICSKTNLYSVGDWQIDYITGGPFEVLITDKADIKVYSMQDGTVCNFPHLIGKSILRKFSVGQFIN